MQNTSFRQEAYINGAWETSTKTFPVTNPASGQVLAQVPDLGTEAFEKAVQAAQAAFKPWAALLPKERGAYLKKWSALIAENAESLAQLLTSEQGKPIEESRNEVNGAAGTVEWFAEEARRNYGEIVPPPRENLRLEVQYVPLGVVAAITPWNFPVSMVTRKVAPAIAAGCTVVLKPSEETPLCALALASLAEKAGIPKGVVNVVTAGAAGAAAFGQLMCSHTLVRKISFTGSTAVGRILMQQAGAQIKKVGLELGGNAPFIIFASADLEKAVEGLIANKFRNAGQTCICANRIFVEKGAEGKIIKLLEEKLKEANIGPLINKEAKEKVEELLADSQKHGAKAVTVSRNNGEGLYCNPVILTGVPVQARIFREEIFGPVAPIYSFESEDEVIVAANDTEYGLAAYIYSGDLAQGQRIMAGLDYGMVGFNQVPLAYEGVPFGGMKQSGIGREGGHWGMKEFMEIKYLAIETR
ncbi:MAG: aldehyde dehydrogenase family protein [Alphaproteobacteria bacterium]|nr:aldehyde dehydrogenase family protein [Alphaproteobacteria bacterium]